MASHPARWLPGTGPPRGGAVTLDGADLFLDLEGGERLTWRLDEVHDFRELPGETHLEVPAEEAGAPRAKLIVHGPEFRDELELAFSRHGARASVGLKRASRRLGVLSWFAIAAVVAVLGYFAYAVLVPRMHVLVPPEREAQLGEVVYSAVTDEWTQMNAPLFAGFMDQVVAELREPDSPYDIRITLVDQPDLNAMALPGGRVVVFSGLVTAAPSPDALAGVLAHELSHVERRHSLKQILRAIGVMQFAGAAVGGGIDGFELAETFLEASSGLLILKHSRLAETESDTLAVAKLRAAGRSPVGLLEFFQLIEKRYGDLPGQMSWISTHPLTGSRIERIRGLIGESGQEGQPKPWMTPEAWGEIQAEAGG